MIILAVAHGPPLHAEDIPKPLLDLYAKAYVENWVAFGGGCHQTYYFLPKTIRRTARGTSTVWSVEVQEMDSTNWRSSLAAVKEQRERVRPGVEGYERYLFSKTQWEVDCRRQLVRILQFIDYDEDGNVIVADQLKHPKFEEPVPDTNGEGLLRSFCHPSQRKYFRKLLDEAPGN
jgi:hypothetical protein